MIDKLDYWRSIELGTYIHGRLLERYSAYHTYLSKLDYWRGLELGIHMICKLDYLRGLELGLI